MTFRSSVCVAAALFGLALATPQAQAMVANPGVSAPAVAESVACRTVRTRVVRPNGRVVYRTKRSCGHGMMHRHHGYRHHGCRMERQRIVRPNGAVVYKQIRRCR